VTAQLSAAKLVFMWWFENALRIWFCFQVIMRNAIMENVFGVYYIPCSLKVYLVDVITAFLVAVKRRRLACPHSFLYHVCVLS